MIRKFFIVYTATTEDGEQVQVIYGERETAKAAGQAAKALNEVAGYSKYHVKVSY